MQHIVYAGPEAHFCETLGYGMWKLISKFTLCEKWTPGSCFISRARGTKAQLFPYLDSVFHLSVNGRRRASTGNECANETSATQVAAQLTWLQPLRLTNRGHCSIITDAQRMSGTYIS